MHGVSGRRRAVWSALLVGSMLVGCGGSTNKPGEVDPSDCPASSSVGHVESYCASTDDCRGGLVCEELTALGYWGGLDSGGETEQICTTTCTEDADCPGYSSAPCGCMAGTCEDGFCRVLTICEG